MNRTEKIALLGKLLQDQPENLQGLKQDQHRISGVVIVGRIPDELFSDEPL